MSDFVKVIEELPEHNNHPIQNVFPKIPEPYLQWARRFERVLLGYKSDAIAESDLQKFQLFLLETGQFNASFTSKEIEQLNYPKSPFAIMNRHTYLRATDTWAMEILRNKYICQHESKRLYPVWIDSPLFWEELGRYCRIFGETEIQEENTIASFASELFDLNTLRSPIWVRMDLQDHQTTSDKKHKFRQQLKTQILSKIIIRDGLDQKLIPFFIRISNRESSKGYDISQIHNALIALFPDIEVSHKTNIQNKLKQLNHMENLNHDDKSWGGIFGMFYKYKCLPDVVNTPEKLCQYAKNKKDEFATLAPVVKVKLSSELLGTGDFVNPVRQWLAKNVDPLVKEFFSNVVFYFPDKFQGVEAIVFCDCVGVPPEFVNSIMGNLGYRIDPVRVIRVILEDFPKLFFNEEDTKKFWELLKVTSINSPSLQDIRDYVCTKISHYGDITASDLEKFADGFIFQSELSQLENSLYTLSGGFKIYGDYIANFLRNYYVSLNKTNMAVRIASDLEIKQALQRFLIACSENNLADAVRITQTISEIMLLTWEQWHFRDEWRIDINSKRVLSNYCPVQSVLITPYAMRAFVRVFQVLDSNNTSQFRISTTNQSYFEWLQNLERLNERGVVVSPTRYLQDVAPESSVIFLEIHSNNVVETKQFPHDVEELLQRMSEWLKKPSWCKQRTLVVDVTLNALNDIEVQNLLKRAACLVNSGWLNLILIQSLTKFCQLGLDKRSAGSFIVINNGKDWREVNKRLKELERYEIVDISTVTFFSYFAGFPELTRTYIELINQNVRFVYNQIMKQLNSLEVLNRERFQITMSSDPKACYVALNMRGLISDDKGFALSTIDIDCLSSDILEHLIHPLCNFFCLPLTERMSIGFPLSSINCVYDSIRFTIGLEPEEQLQLYADILAYVSFVLNRQRNSSLFFDVFERQKYFEEKVTQFQAMTPDKSCSYSFEFASNDSYNCYINHSTGRSHQLRRRISIDNGNLTILREIPDSQYRNPFYPQCDRVFRTNVGTVLYPYSDRDIKIPVRGKGDLSLSKLDISMRRMAIACLNTYVFQGQENDDNQNVNLLFDNLNHTLTFASMEMLGAWNGRFTYGPFYLNANGRQQIFFYFYQKDICCLIGDNIYREDSLVIKQGNIMIPLLDMPLEDREFIFREGPYRPDRAGIDFHNKYRFARLDMQYIPENSHMLIYVKDRKLVIEVDFVCCNEPGITVYKRFLGENLTCFEIDFWGEKDPILARFMRLMIAIYVRNTQNVGFSARNSHFSNFIFNLAYERSDVLFREAVKKILDNKCFLNNIMEQLRSSESIFQYYFANSSLSWPSSHSGVSYVGNKALIDEALRILGIPCIPLESRSANNLLQHCKQSNPTQLYQHNLVGDAKEEIITIGNRSNQGFQFR